MELILYLIRRKSRRYFNADNWKKLLVDATLFLILLLYAFGAAALLNMKPADNFANELAQFSKQQMKLLIAIGYTLYFVPVFLKFFPNMTLRKSWLASNYPVTRLKRASMELWAMSLYKTVHVYIVLSILCFTGVAVVFTTITLHLALQISGMLCLCFLGGILTAEGLINAISWRHSVYIVFLVVIVSLVGYFWQGLASSAAESYSFLLLLNFLLIGLYYLCYQVNPEVSVSRGRTAKLDNDPYKRTYWHLSWRNKSYRTLLLLSFVFHFAFLNFFLWEAIQKSDGAALTFEVVKASQPIIALFITPMLLFSYCFNNIWGFFPNLKRTHIIINSQKSTVLKTYYHLVLPVVGLNILLSLINVWAYRLLDWPLVLFMVVSTIYYVSVSLIGSYLKYIKVTGIGFMQMRQNTSFIINMTMILPVMGLCFLPLASTSFYIGIGSLLLISCLSFWWFFRQYEKKLLPQITPQLFS